MTESIRNARTTGAICPSSPALARQMAASLSPHRTEPIRVLEVGPGLGAFTRTLLDRMRPGDSYDLVEINEAFCSQLESRLLQPYRNANAEVKVTLWRSAIEQASLSSGFDHIICGLPFNNFSPRETRVIFAQMLDLLKPGGDLVYFEYVAVRPLRRVVSDATGRRHIRTHSAMRKVLNRRHDGRRSVVWLNMPPARVVRLTR